VLFGVLVLLWPVACGLGLGACGLQLEARKFNALISQILLTFALSNKLFKTKEL
jgi:hypothetical protein